MKAFVLAYGAREAAGLTTLVKSLGFECALICLDASPESFAHAYADEVLHLVGKSPRKEDYSHAIAAILPEEALLIVEGSCSGRETAATIATQTNRPLLFGVEELSAQGALICGVRMDVRHTYRVEQRAGFRCVVVMAPGAYLGDIAPDASPIQVIRVQSDNRVRRVAAEHASASIGLAESEAIVAIGAGVQDEEVFGMCQGIAEALGANLACTRNALELRDEFTSAQMVGITGVSVNPRLYLSFGVSGQPQHLYGVRKAGCIAAIDRNAHAPIFRECDYGLVGDLESVLPILVHEFSKQTIGV